MNRRTRIVCTIGPACRAPDRIAALIRAGMDVARLHFSYADQDEHIENIRRIREVSGELGREIKILQDLSGAKCRVKHFAREPIELKPGSDFTLTAHEIEGNESVVSVSVPELLSVARPGDIVLLADGAIELEAVSCATGDVRCKVLTPGRLKSRQAVHIKDKNAPISVPTVKDLDDVRFGIQHGVDWIALSSVTSAHEINDLRDFIRHNGADIPIIAKIERREAMKNLEALSDVADMLMVACGDLGMDIPMEETTLAQKHIIHCANKAGKPVITATELLSSMIESNRPTRAEISDVTNAILDGTDAVMLSGETGVGKFPVESVLMMNRIVLATEDHVSKTSNGLSSIPPSTVTHSAL